MNSKNIIIVFSILYLELVAASVSEDVPQVHLIGRSKSANPLDLGKYATKEWTLCPGEANAPIEHNCI